MKQNYWTKPDFWIACLAAIIFWLAYGYYFAPEKTNTTPTHFNLLLLIIIFPVLEEIVFRGLIQESIQQLLANNHLKTRLCWRISRANLITSLFFSVAHLWSQSTLWALAIIVPSVIFGYFKDRYQSLLPSIWLHIFYNLGFYLLL